MRGRQEALQSALSEENMKAQRKRREENKGRSETEGEKEERENSPAFGLSEKGDGGGDGGVWTLSFPSKKIREALPQFSLISGELPEAPPLVCVCGKVGRGLTQCRISHADNQETVRVSLFYTCSRAYTV